jgi:hypothetical protein
MAVRACARCRLCSCARTLLYKPAGHCKVHARSRTDELEAQLRSQILDGVNRWQACMTLAPANEKLVSDLMFTEYKGPDPIAYVISANVKPRHLDVGQRSMIAAELATMRQGERTDKDPSSNSKSTETAAKELNVSPRLGLHQLLDEAMLAFLEDDEVLDDVEEAGGTAGTFDQRI